MNSVRKLKRTVNLTNSTIVMKFRLTIALAQLGNSWNHLPWTHTSINNHFANIHNIA